MVSATLLTNRALSAIKRTGAQVTFTTSGVSMADYDVDNARVPDEDVEQTSFTVWASPIVQARQGFGRPDSPMVARDGTVYVPNQGYEPKIGMTMTLGSTTWSVVVVLPTYFKSDAVVYEVGLAIR